MKDENRTKSELIKELKSLRRRNKRLEATESKRKHVEKLLRESEVRWRSLISNSPDFIALHDREGRYLFINHYAEGFTEKDIDGKKAYDFISKESREIYRAAFEECIRTMTKQNVKYSALGDNAETRMYESSFVPIMVQGNEINVLDVARDITECRLAEEKLRESEARYRSLFGNSLMGISQALPDGRLLCANSAYAKMYGYENPEKIIAAVSDIGKQHYANPEDREEVLHILKEKGVMEPREMTVKRRDGSRFFVLVSAREIRDPKGNLSYYQAEHVDITERKLAEEALCKSEATLSDAMRIASLGTWEYDVARDQFTFNDHFYALFHTTAEREGGYVMSSMHYAQKFVHPEDMTLVGVEIQKALDTDDPNYYSRLDHRILYADGDMGYISVYIRIEKDAQGRTVKTHGVNQDITERKRAELALKKSNEKFIQAQSLAHIGSWEDYLPTNELHWSKEMYNIMGFPPDTPINLADAVRVFPQEDMERFQQAVKSSIEKDVPYSMDYKIVRTDGTIRYIHDEGKVIRDEHDRAIWMIGTTQDITERKRNEEELQRSRKELRMLANHFQNIREEERTHLAREFHDQLGQSMTALKMDLSLLLKMISDEKQDVQRKHIAEELRSMQKLVDETVNMIWVIISELRPQMLEDLGLVTTLEWEANQFGSRTGISCEFKSSAGEIQMDSKKSIALFRIYQEALTNIAHHADATVVRSVLRRDNEALVLEIKDNGRGITLDEQLKPDSFGIISMRERALALGGLLEISGIAGEGTSIKVRLPLEKIDEQASTSK